MNILIIKLGASGDVVRTTALLRRLEGRVTWITSTKNRSLLDGIHLPAVDLRVLNWEDRVEISGETFDLVINLEDEPEVADALQLVKAKQIYGAYKTADGRMAYTDSAKAWFDMSLISVHGREQADQLKFLNRRPYQDLVFSGLGWAFSGETYLLPPVKQSGLQGDIAIAQEAGPVWPIKNWAHYDWLKQELENRGFTVNVLPKRPTLLEHIADIQGHRCLVGADSLPMHLALGAALPTVAIFNCTSPWEIYEYGILTKLVSPLLGEFFYKRSVDQRAMTAVTKDAVLSAVLAVAPQQELRHAFRAATYQA